MKPTLHGVMLLISAACFLIGALIFADVLIHAGQNAGWAWGFGGASAFVLAHLPPSPTPGA